MEIINRQAQKVVAKGGRLLEGYNCKTSTGKIWVFWIGGRLWQVVARERWSYIRV